MLEEDVMDQKRSDETREMTAMEACRRLGVSLDYLYRLLYAQRLPARKVDNVWRISAEAVEERVRRREARIAA
jgi:excisionase family DNA binding protein